MPKAKLFDADLKETQAIKKIHHRSGRGIEIGIGSGLFAQPLGIQEGIDPFVRMRENSKERSLEKAAL